jgi:hypothetical protein
MPDLNTITQAMCASNIYWEHEVPGKDYIVRFERVNEELRGVLYDYTCTCKDYKYRRAEFEGEYCKHIKDARKERCGWDQLLHRGEPERKPDGYSCPRCGDEIEFYNAAV